MDYGSVNKRKINPKQQASTFSLLSFFYVFQIYKLGTKGSIKENDLFCVINKLRSKKLGNQLESIYKKLKSKSESISTFQMMVIFCFKKYLKLGIMQLLMKTFFVVSVPHALGKFVNYFSPDKNQSSKMEPIIYGYVYLVLLLIQYFYEQNYELLKTELRIELQTGLCSLIYRKAMRLTPEALSKITSGKIISLITKDINVFEIILLLNDLFIELVQVIILCCLFYNKVGNATFAGFGVLLAPLPIQIMIAKIVKGKRIISNQKSDERFQITEETLSSIRTIKMHAWEDYFQNKIINARRGEMTKLRLILMLKDTSYLLGRFCATMSSYILIATYVWLGNKLNAEMVFYIISAYENIEFTATHLLPNCLSRFAELLGSIERYDVFFDAEEIDYFKDGSSTKPFIKLENVGININNKTVQNISLDFKQGVNVITGPVGSGKSTLIKAILKEQSIDGKISVVGVISYASQTPWLFPSTLKQNILFGEPYDFKKYQNILKICALDFDLKLLEEGDRTLICDCGVNLSKGQQARVNLARAVYKNADIYLLDDCFSSLDANVRSYVFTSIKRYLKDKISVVITHDYNLLSEGDQVVILDNSKVIYNGNPKNIPREISNVKLHENLTEEEKIQSIEEENDETNHLLKNEKLKITNIYEETQNWGKVPWSVYHKYVKLGGGYIFFVIIIILIVSGGGLIALGKKVLSNWVDLDESIDLISINSTNEADYNLLMDKRTDAFSLYTIITALGIFFCILSLMSHFVFSCNVSIKLHNNMLKSILQTKMNFFDKNLIGNILNRFSKDLYYIDEVLVFSVNDFGFIFVIVISTALMISSLNLLFTIASVIFLFIFIILGNILLPISRNLRRLNSSTRSPVVGYLNSSLDGSTTIRAFKKLDLLIAEFDKHQDLYTTAHHTMAVFQAGFSLLLKLISLIFTSLIIGNFLFMNSDLAGNVGLALTQVSLLSKCVEQCLNIFVGLESDMTCLERALKYAEQKAESDNETEIKNWPAEGKIVFEEISLSYGLEKKQVLNNLSFKINKGEKIAIVGRTGAGKSSLIVTIYRLYEFLGKLSIDDIDIKNVSLKKLRSSITLIPQDPLLFTGSIRSNLDPLNKYSDSAIWESIKEVGLENTFKNLSDSVNLVGNLSIGQKQLVCIARALLENNKIIVMDEATANMDDAMDDQIHILIGKYFKNCTVLLISHKLKPTIRYDKVLVMEQGNSIQFGSPEDLLRDKNGLFYTMARNANIL